MRETTLSDTDAGDRAGERPVDPRDLPAKSAATTRRPGLAWRFGRTVRHPGLVFCLGALVALAFPVVAAAGGIQTDGQLVSTVEAGTPPLAVSSPDRVDNLNADLLDGFDSSAFRFDGVIYVGKNGTGDFESIQAAIDSIPADPISIKQMLIVVGPGTYQEQVKLRAGVFLRGSGRERTQIRFLGGNTFDSGSAALVIAPGVGVEDLSVRVGTNPAQTNYAVGIYHESAAKIRRVDVHASGAAIASIGILNRDRLWPWLSIEDSDVSSATTAPFSMAVWNEAGLKILRSYLSGPTALYNSSASPDSHFDVDVDHTEINGNRDNAVVDDDEFRTYLRHSILTYNSGTVDSRVTCLGVIKSQAFYENTCP